jgi:hypothetical protein
VWTEGSINAMHGALRAVGNTQARAAACGEEAIRGRRCCCRPAVGRRRGRLAGSAPHRRTQSGETDARNQRATKSYSRHASPPPSSSSVAGSTGVMGGWSPASTPPWWDARDSRRVAGRVQRLARRPRQKGQPKRCRRWQGLLHSCGTGRARSSAASLPRPASRAPRPHLGQACAGGDHRARVLAPYGVPRLRRQRALHVEVWGVGGALGPRVGQVAARVEALGDLARRARARRAAGEGGGRGRQVRGRSRSCRRARRAGTQGRGRAARGARQGRAGEGGGAGVVRGGRGRRAAPGCPARPSTRVEARCRGVGGCSLPGCATEAARWGAGRRAERRARRREWTPAARRELWARDCDSLNPPPPRRWKAPASRAQGPC